MGVERKSYKKTNFEQDLFALISAMKKNQKGWDKITQELFEKECKSLGFEIQENNGCELF